MKTIIRTIETTTPRGTRINFTAEIIRGYINKDQTIEGILVNKMVAVKEDNLTIEVNGRIIKGDLSTGMFVPAELRNKGVYATFGGKIGLDKVTYDKIEAVIEAARKEAEEDGDYKNYMAQVEKANKINKAYNAYSEQIDNMMTLNNNTF